MSHESRGALGTSARHAATRAPALGSGARVEGFLNPLADCPFRYAGGIVVTSQPRGDGRVFLYGPFRRDGQHTAPSNAVFDSSLREGNPEWGVRDIADVEKLATDAGLAVCRDLLVRPPGNDEAHHLALALGEFMPSTPSVLRQRASEVHRSSPSESMTQQ